MKRDMERFFQEILYQCSRLGAKAAHFPGYLPTALPIFCSNHPISCFDANSACSSDFLDAELLTFNWRVC